MDRRLFLKSISASILSVSSGCSQLLREQDIRVTNFSNLNDIDVSFTGEVVQQLSKDGPLRVELRFTNEGPERMFGFDPVLPGLYVNPSRTLFSVPDNREPIGPWKPDGPDGFVPDEPDGGCWRALNSIVVASYVEWRTLDTGEKLTERYTILANSEADRCFPPGTHRFESSFDLESEHPLHYDVVVP